MLQGVYHVNINPLDFREFENFEVREKDAC